MRGTRGALFGAVAIVFGLGIVGIACSSEDAGDPSDGSSDVRLFDGGRPDSDGGNEATSNDRLAPRKITDLTATTDSHAGVKLTWTAPSDDTGGKARSYDLRYAKSLIRTAAEFTAAMTAPAPAPGPGGATQTTTVTGLDPNTEYHFAIRARDEAGNVAPISNDASATTKPRARLLITEVGVTNLPTTGYDFVELVATAPGSAEGIEIKTASLTLYKLAPIDLPVGARLVVHMTGLPSPPGSSQEDKTKSSRSSTSAFATPEAFDLYSAIIDLGAADATISVIDGPDVVDAVALSNRDGDASAAAMAAFGVFRSTSAWTFASVPVDGANDCEIQREAVNISPSAAASFACGRFATTYNPTVSLSANRNGLTDTNSKADFYMAPQTMGMPNAAIPPPKVVSAAATSATSVTLTFDQEIAPATVSAAMFSIPDLTVSTVTLSNVHQVTLTTSAQTETGYEVAIGGGVTNLQGVALAASRFRFCGFTPIPATLILNEVHPNIDANNDLVELLVTHGGSIGGYELRLDPTSGFAAGTVLAALPPICAATGDLVVLHLNPSDADSPNSETLRKNEIPAATFASNHDGAWDVVGWNILPFSNFVLALRSTAGAYVDAAVFTRGTTFSPNARDALLFMQSLAAWKPANCGGVPCDVSSAQSVAASIVGVGTTAAGNSLRRMSAAPQASSWVIGPPSFGAAN